MSKPANKIFDGSTASGANDSSAAPSRDAASGTTVETEIERTDFPCSVAQERFWLLDRLDPGNASYNVAVRWRLEGRVSTDLLERAWLAIIDRHEILRTVFLEVDGAPIQRIMPASPFRMAEIDLSTLPTEQQPTEGDRIGMIEARAPFDVQTGPLIRATLLRFSSSISIILVTTHQIVSDGWSIGVMAREMGVIYDALRHDRAVPLEPLQIQYADYSLWQLEWLRVRGTAAETEYWTQQLAGVKPFKVIPDRPRPAMATTNGVIVSRVLPRELTNRAQSLCAERGATLFAAALGALCAMLSRYTREEEIVLGTQVSDRNQVELEGMVGQFVNSLILRNDLSGDPRFVEVIDRVRDTTAQALENRHIPIERLLGMVKGEHGKANTPPISVNFIFQKTFIQNTAYTDFSLIDMPSLPAGAIYDLNFFMVERPDGWRFSLQYNTDQFEHGTANRMLAYFQTVLEDATSAPQRRVSELRMSSPDESRRLLREINQSHRQAHGSKTVMTLIDAHVEQSPNAIAVVCGGEAVTYGDFNLRAERIAIGLRARGIGLGSRVAICVDRSPELPSLVFALMKIGASCLLVDPSEGRGFLQHSVQTARVSAVAVRNSTRVPWSDSASVVIDIAEVLADRSSPKQLAAHPGVAPNTEAYFNQGHYVLHGALAGMLVDVAARIGMSANDVFVAASPLGRDVAVAELLLPLVCGATSFIASPRDLDSPRNLVQLLKRSGATVLHASAATWSALQESGWAPRAPLKMLSSHGPLSGAIVPHLLQPGAELWSLYGSTETNIWAAVNPVRSRLDVPMLGSPVGEATFDLCDSKRRPPEVGSTSTLQIVNDAGAIVFCTGDLARVRADGQIELLGRDDGVFYYKGYRVDPSAIEALLKKHPQVRAAVVADGKQSYEGNLVACVAVAECRPDQKSALIDAIRSDLEVSIPAALMPTIIVVDELPLERDGSLNFRKLQSADSPESAHPAAEGLLGGVEQGLAAIWTALLGVQDIEPSANFFELGGHSLLAARMLARVNTVFGRRVTLNTLFRAATLRELAQVIETKDPREFDFRQMVKLQPHGSRPPLIAINNTGTYYPLAKSLGPDQPVISLQLFDPSVKTDTMPETLEEVATRYVELIQRVQPNGPYNLMGWCVAGALSFEIARQLTAANKPVTSLYLMDSWVPGYIQRQPPLRRMVSDYSLRWGLMRAEWRKTRSDGRSLTTFLANRNAVKALRYWWDRLGNGRPAKADINTEELTREDYDLWLLRYLQAITLKYVPRRFPGKLTLFRSIEEPTGLFFDPLAGWGDYADQVRLVMVEGDHYTMFQDRGAKQMAAEISQAMTTLKTGKV